MQKEAEVDFFLALFKARFALAEAHALVVGQNLDAEEAARLYYYIDQIEKQAANFKNSLSMVNPLDRAE